MPGSKSGSFSSLLKGEGTLKITDVECLVLDRSFPFVRVYTDEGIVGIGECFHRQPRVTKMLVEDLLKPSLVGKDPLDTELRWRDMARRVGPGAGWCDILRHRRSGHRPLGHQGQGAGNAHLQAVGWQA